MKKFVAASVLASASLFALATPALAQDTPAPAEGEVADEAEGNVIIVEARRRDESAQDVPLVVTPSPPRRSPSSTCAISRTSRRSSPAW